MRKSFKVCRYRDDIFLWFDERTPIGKKYYLRKKSLIVGINQLTENEKEELEKVSVKEEYSFKNLKRIKDELMKIEYPVAHGLM